MVKLAKKGDLSLIQNYHGIMLRPTARKIMNRVILESAVDNCVIKVGTVCQTEGTHQICDVDHHAVL